MVICLLVRLADLSAQQEVHALEILSVAARLLYAELSVDTEAAVSVEETAQPAPVTSWAMAGAELPPVWFNKRCLVP